MYAGLTGNEPLAGVMALSTYLPLHREITDSVVQPANIPSVFMAHGSYDPVIPISYAEQSMKQLRSLGLSVDWNTYDMEHSLNAEEVFAIREWLIERLDNR